MKISFILYVFQVFGKNQYLTSHGIMYVFDDFLNFLNLTFIGIMYVFADFREKIFFTYCTFYLQNSAKKIFLLTFTLAKDLILTSIFYTSGMHN